MGVRVRLLAISVALAIVRPAPSGGQSATAPPFSGSYRLVLTFDPGCPAPLQVGPQRVRVEVGEATVAAGSEVSGRSASPAEPPEDIAFVLLRQGDRLHGPFGARDAPFVGFRTLEGYRVWMRIVADGSATTASGRARAEGKAFGEIDLSRPGDPDVDTIGACSAIGHRWSLEPE